MASQHSVQPEKVAESLRYRGAGPVGAIERRAEILEELGAIGQHGRAEMAESLDPANLPDWQPSSASAAVSRR